MEDHVQPSMGEQTSSEESGGHDWERARILVVDDEEQIVGLLSQALQAAGFVVETRADGASAVDALTSEGFDLVITDLEMPGLSGEAVLRAAKGLDPPIPVMFFTARLSEQERARLRLLGADEILLKPSQMSELVWTIRGLLAPPGRNLPDD